MHNVPNKIEKHMTLDTKKKKKKKKRFPAATKSKKVKRGGKQCAWLSSRQ
jgi:hypothetical protein